MKNKKTTEKKVIISLIVSLVVWYGLSYYYKKNSSSIIDADNIKNISDSIDNIVNNKNIQKGGNVNKIDKTYNVLGTGINIPHEGITIPDVLIDYV